MIQWWEVFADESGRLVFERHREGHEPYCCPAWDLSAGWKIPALGLSDGVHVLRWAVICWWSAVRESPWWVAS